MFIVGHGANQPVVSNATAAGKARNSRVELVIYPEKSRRPLTSACADASARQSAARPTIMARANLARRRTLAP